MNFTAPTIPTKHSVFEAAFFSGLKPEPELTVSEWADQHRMLSSKSSAEPGQWMTSRTPYLREIMDCLSASNPISRVVVMAGAQVGKTECGNNWIGYVIDQCPGPMLMVQPTVDMAKKVSKQRIAPMIESTPKLREKVKEARVKDSGNTTFVKEFDGGLLILTGANSAAGLRSMPIRFLFMDEVDEYPGDVDGQGDAALLAEKRTSTFSRKKIMLTSTPTLKDISRIEREWLKSDQRRYFVPCPHCHHMDWIRWENIRWDEGKPDTARLMCIACEKMIDEGQKTWMLSNGNWVPSEESATGTAGFHISALYSPLGFKAWSECVLEFLEAKPDPFRFRTWVNTVLGETWEERGESVEPDHILARREEYGAQVPNGVGILVASVDVQMDRLEVKVKGYGAGEESWLIAYHQIFGDPGREEVWVDLTAYRKMAFKHQSGQLMRIEIVTIDSGGQHTEYVYRYAKAFASERVFAIRGGSVKAAPLVSRPTVTGKYRQRLFTLGVDTGKDMVYSRLRITVPGPGYMHMPDWIDMEYCEQLTAEKMVRRYIKGRGVIREWVKFRDRNEALDLEVYCLAALYILGQPVIRTLPERAAKMKLTSDNDTIKKAIKARRKTGYVQGWRM